MHILGIHTKVHFTDQKQLTFINIIYHFQTGFCLSLLSLFLLASSSFLAVVTVAFPLVAVPIGSMPWGVFVGCRGFELVNTPPWLPSPSVVVFEWPLWLPSPPVVVVFEWPLWPPSPPVGVSDALPFLALWTSPFFGFLALTVSSFSHPLALSCAYKEDKRRLMKRVCHA